MTTTITTIERSAGQPTVLVTGSVRSGTSVMMRMLHAADVPVLYDDTKPPDVSNPGGYYEYSGVRLLRQGVTAWLDAARGAAVKILPSELLYHLPLDRRYVVLFMERAAEAVAESYWRLVHNGSRPVPPAVQAMEQADFVRIWTHRIRTNSRAALEYLESMPGNFEILRVEHARLAEQLPKIGGFIGQALGREVTLRLPPREAPPLPSPARRVLNFAGAVVAESMHLGAAPISPARAEERLEICRKCLDYYRPIDGTCAACGCDLRDKVLWRSQHCPMGKW